MSNKSKLLISIRPVIDVITENSTIAESFQSNTLRPILKLQNETLLSLFRFHIMRPLQG